MKKEIETIQRVRYSKNCPICKKSIKGFSESQVNYNLKIHIEQKHPKKGGENENL